MTKGMIDDCRKAFEEYCERELICIKPLSEPGAPPHMNYTAWQLWQAAWSTRATLSAVQQPEDGLDLSTSEVRAFLKAEGGDVPLDTAGKYIHPHRVAKQLLQIMEESSQDTEGWRPIETAPKDGHVLLVSTNEGKDKIPTVGEWGKFCKYNGPEFTHWMPLPKQPTKAPEQEA